MACTPLVVNCQQLYFFFVGSQLPQYSKSNGFGFCDTLRHSTYECQMGLKGQNSPHSPLSLQYGNVVSIYLWEDLKWSSG